MFSSYYEEKLTSTSGIAKDWIDVSLTTNRSCTGTDYDIKITSLVDKIVIQKVVIRRILTSRYYKRKERLRIRLANNKRLTLWEKRRQCIYRLTDNKRLTLKKSLSVNYGFFDVYLPFFKSYRVSIATDKGIFDYFHLG